MPHQPPVPPTHPKLSRLPHQGGNCHRSREGKMIFQLLLVMGTYLDFQTQAQDSVRWVLTPPLILTSSASTVGCNIVRGKSRNFACTQRNVNLKVVLVGRMKWRNMITLRPAEFKQQSSLPIPTSPASDAKRCLGTCKSRSLPSTARLVSCSTRRKKNEVCP